MRLRGEKLVRDVLHSARAQSSHYRIFAEVAYTTDNWKTSKTWCSYDIYGKLDVGDPVARLDFYEPSRESARAIFQECQKRLGKRGTPDAKQNTAL